MNKSIRDFSDHSKIAGAVLNSFSKPREGEDMEIPRKITNTTLSYKI